METQKRKSFSFILFVTCLLFSIAVGAAESVENPGDVDGSFVSHEEHFTDNPYEGTQSCLGSTCHDMEANDVLMTGHWKWQGIAANIEGVEGEIHGKNDLINNFCVAVPTNEGRCAQCHIGYGYVDQNFDFGDVTKIDCLICHDQTDTYKKGPTTGGLPDPLVDLQFVAKSVGDNGGVPGRKNCIVCHANAGGGDNVKHGDLSLSMESTTREFDVHMGTDGADMTCVACHDVDRNQGGQVSSHGIGGMPYHSVDEGTMIQCVDCHDNPSPLHTGEIQSMVQTHERLACQVCHIPAIARHTSTKVEWYWSDAGQDIDPIPIDPITGRPTYDKKKGTFVWALDVRPTLRFHNGKWHRAMIGINDIALEEPVDLGSPAADRSDPDAMIYPFKKMIGDQVVDDEYDTVLVPHLFGTAGGPYPYWGNWDWDLALWDAFDYPTGQIFSGEHEFVDTEMLLAVNHEIAPKEDSLGMDGVCSDCHGVDPDGEDLIDWPALGWDEDPLADVDSDGVVDNLDNCTLVPNGPLILDAGGNSQLDTDGDGYGNLCDADLNNTEFVDYDDLALFSGVFFTADADADFNGDGFVDFLDLTLFSGMFFQAPGPSCVDLTGGCAP